MFESKSRNEKSRFIQKSVSHNVSGQKYTKNFNFAAFSFPFQKIVVFNVCFYEKFNRPLFIYFFDLKRIFFFLEF